MLADRYPEFKTRLNFATIIHLTTITERMSRVFWDMAARIVTLYGLDDPGRQDSFPKGPNRLSGPPSLLLNVCRGMTAGLGN